MVYSALFVFGIVLILVCSHYLVLSACKLGHALHWPDILIGIVILGIGTSMPEIVISIYSHLTGHSGVLLGNILGSNIANSLLILGLGLLLSQRVKLSFIPYRKSYGLMMLLSVILTLAVYWQDIPRVVGLAIFIVGILSLIQANHHPVENVITNNTTKPHIIGYILLLFILLIGIMISAQLIVNNGLQLADTLGLNGPSFAALFIAIGTSLPEIAVTIAAASQKKLSLVFSTVLGSNIANIAFAVGLSALIKPIIIHSNHMQLLAVLALVASTLVAVIIKATNRLNKLWGVGLLIFYTLIICLII